MTILPKKKAGKEHGEGETVDHEAHTHSGGSEQCVSPPPSHVNHVNHVPHNHWGLECRAGGRDEGRLAPHDPGGGHEPHPSTSHTHSHPHPHTHSHTHSHNKRRHRSSPHRTIRKHRNDNHSHRSDRGEGGHRSNRETLRPQGHAAQAHPIPAGTVPHTTQLTVTALPGQSSPPTERDCLIEPMPDLELDQEKGNNSEDEYGTPPPVALPGSPSAQNITNFDELERWFAKALKEKRGLLVKDMGTDGACLFRAVADQIFGDQDMHSCVRRHCVEYMAQNSDFFKHYVTEDFSTYLKRKLLDTCHGNHIEMQAMSELYNRPIEVFQYTTEPINIFHGAYSTENDPIRVSYHRNAHYNSVFNPYKATIGVGLGLPGHQPGAADKNLMNDAKKQSEDFHIEKTMLEDKIRETDWEVTQETIEEQVARESYLQWLRDNEKRAQRQPTRSASATCSSASESQSMWESSTSSAAAEARPTRSPRNRSASNSGQNSPCHPGTSSTVPLCPSPQPGRSDAGGGILLSVSPQHPSTSEESHSIETEGAVGGAGISFPETSSIMNELPPTCYGLNDWEEDDILARVIAQSQQEYLDNLKKSSTTSSNNDSDTS